MTEASVTPELSAQLRRLLASATPATVPSGVLVWWGAGPLPDGKAPSPALDQMGWAAAYMRLEAGALAPGIVRPLPEVLALIGRNRPDGPLPLAVACFRYAVPSAELIARVRSAVDEGRPMRHPPLTLEGQLDEREAFFCCGLLHDQWGTMVPSYRGQTVPLLLMPELVLSNRDKRAPDRIEVDPGDGGGFRTLTPGTPLETEYGPATGATLSVRCRYGASTLSAGFKLTLSAEPAAPETDERWALKGDAGNTGTAYVYRSPGNAAVRRPLIIVEGFPGGQAPDYLYETLNQQRTAEQLRAAGYDLVIVGLDRGTDPIQRNAEVLVDCIRTAIERTEEPLVVGGISMGGLISRFALAAMESRGEAHQTSVFLTIDTPHAGSYTSLGAQWFVHTFVDHLPGLAAEAWLLDSPANQQFVLWWVHNGKAQRSPLREAFVKELADLGDYPQIPRRLAVSCGSGDGSQSAKPGVRTLAWSAEPWLGVELHAISGAGRSTLATGHWFLADPQSLPALTFEDGPAWDVAPGGQDFYNAQVAMIAQSSGCGTVEQALGESCQVPTVSALDLHSDPFKPVPAPGSGGSPFHDYVCAEANQPHLTITPKLSGWLLSALTGPASPGPAPGDGRPAVPSPTAAAGNPTPSANPAPGTPVPSASPAPGNPTPSASPAPGNPTPSAGPAPGAPAAAATPPARSTAPAPGTPPRPSGFDPSAFDPHDPAFLANPYPTYALFREQAPIYPVKGYEGASWVFRYDDCRRLLTDTAVWVKNSPLGPTSQLGPYCMMSSFPEGMFASDPPLHTQLRQLVEPVFAQAIQAAPALTDELATPLLQAARQRGRFELISEYALRLPARVLFTLMGIPDGPPDHLGVWEGLIDWQARIAAAHDRTQSLIVRGTGAVCSMALNSFFEGMLLENPPSAGLFAEICRTFKGAGLSDQASQVLACDFVVAGYLSTTFVIGTGVRNLLEHPQQLEALRRNPALYEPALAEMMRYDGPVQLIDRVAATETELGGHEFKAGDRVGAVVGSADRDAGGFTDPDDFLITREPNDHLGFGKGIHYCIGEPLVKLVAPVALRRLIEAFPDLALAGQPQWQTDPYLRAVTNLPLQT
ncbi:MAG TPA: cytochrome P450 [Solirubrobacteraceae bacterium]|jgi:unspecific monooxygenase